MTKDVETEFDGTTLVVRIPMRFQRPGGRKHIIAADGSELVPAAKPQPQPDGTLVKALARAWRWQRLLDAGVYSSVTAMRRRGSGSRTSAASYGSRCWHRISWRESSRDRSTQS